MRLTVCGGYGLFRRRSDRTPTATRLFKVGLVFLTSTNEEAKLR